MRRFVLTATLMLAPALLLQAAPAGARARGPVCRRECRPRIEEQCDGLHGGALRRCRRPLVRACKATTPAIGCPSTADLQHALEDTHLRLGGVNDADVTLCATGRFELVERVPADPTSFVRIVDRRSGVWDVRVADGGLVLDLEGETTPLAFDATGALLVDGQTTLPTDAAAACTPDTITPPPPSPEAIDQERLVALTRTLTDRTIVIDAPDGSIAEQRTLRLCRSGRVTDTTSTDDGVVEATVEGAWTVALGGSEALLQLDEGLGQPVFGIERLADGTLLVDGEAAAERDARAECAAEDLRDDLTAALSGTAWFFVQQVGTVPVRVKLGLCDSGRYHLESTSAESGTWRVAIAGGIPSLELVRDDGASRAPLAVALTADGAATVEGTDPIDVPSLVDAACRS